MMMLLMMMMIIVVVTMINIAEQMASGARRSITVCIDETTLATEIAEGAGKCMPAIAKTREDTGRPACGPEHSWPPDRVSSRMTMAMPRVNADELKARLYVFPEKQVATNLTALRMARPTPSQRKKDMVPGQPWVEPLVSSIVVQITVVSETVCVVFPFASMGLGST